MLVNEIPLDLFEDPTKKPTTSKSNDKKSKKSKTEVPIPVDEESEEESEIILVSKELLEESVSDEGDPLVETGVDQTVDSDIEIEEGTDDPVNLLVDVTPDSGDLEDSELDGESGSSEGESDEQE